MSDKLYRIRPLRWQLVRQNMREQVFSATSLVGTFYVKAEVSGEWWASFEEINILPTPSESFFSACEVADAFNRDRLTGDGGALELVKEGE